MALSKRMREEISRLCGNPSPEDGSDPRDFHQHKSRQEKRNHHKQLRLCRQVAQTLSLAISDCPDPELRELSLDSVLPTDAASALLVTLRAETSDIEQCEMFRSALAKAEGWFRAEVATAISRRRVPRLNFVVMPAAKTEENENG